MMLYMLYMNVYHLEKPRNKGVANEAPSDPAPAMQ